MNSTADQAQKYLVTMALPYANGDIHLGHLVEAVQTDVFVRFQKLRGNQVVYICADDTHGTPIELSALSQKITPEELVATAHKNHAADYARFNIGFDLFYSTNSPENRQYAEFIFTSLQQKGLINEREIEQYYCEHDARFLPDRFIMGTCPRCNAPDQYGDVCEVCGATYEPNEIILPQCKLCGSTPVLRTSKHLFVDLKKEEAFLKEFLDRPGVLQQDMKNFVNHWIEQGLQEWCISRDGPYFGFPIPGYPGKFFYVWLDAPIGYLSSTAKWCADAQRPVQEFWAANADARVVHFIGKDIVYFHTLFWPVMLKNAGFNLPARFFIHGFLTVQGEKMSKSRGTFILARRFLDTVNHPQATEFLRFYFAAKLSANTADLDLNFDDFCTRVNTTLANNIGNLHHRTFVFAERYFQNAIPDAPWDEAIQAQCAPLVQEVASAYENADYKTVVEKIHALGSIGNKYYQDSKPWELIKTDTTAAAVVIVTCANLVRTIATLLKPIVPDTVKLFEDQLGAPFSWNDVQFGLRNCPAGATPKLVQPIEAATFDALLAPVQTRPQQDTTNHIAIEDVAKVELKVGTVVAAETVPKSKKLLLLQVQIDTATRQIVAGIAEHYTPQQLLGRQVVVVANLKPAKLMGIRSEGMVLAAKMGDTLSLIQPDSPIPPGATVA